MEQENQHKEVNNPLDRFEFALPFFIETTNEKGERQIEIVNEKLILFWESLGYKKVVDEAGNYMLVHIKKGSIVKEIREHFLRNEVRNYLNYTKKHEVWGVFLRSDYVVKKLFESFEAIDMTRKTGDEKTGYLYYQNLILKVTTDNVEFIEYEDFEGFIWEREIIKRDFVQVENAECIFGDFVLIIANQEIERLKSIISIIGYLIHSYKDPSFSKAVILMDSEIDVEYDEANGGTGKSMIGKAVSHIVPILFVDGKTMKSNDKFRLSGLNNHHRVIVFDDVKSDFDFESLYPMITGDLYIEKKYKNAVVIPSNETPKLLITSNYVVKGGGGNAEKRRKVEYEVSTYFKNVLTPYEEFGHRLFDDWDEIEWVKFDNFMVKALQFYLKNGMIEPQSINIDYNRLKLETSIDFMDFMDNIISKPESYLKQGSTEILIIDKNKLFDNFNNKKPNTAKRITPIIFKKWIDKYCNYYQIPTNHYKSNGNVFVEMNISNLIRNESNENVSEN
jgi:hypothetical protein